MNRTKPLALAGSAFVLVMAGAGLALASGSSVTIDVPGGYGVRYSNVCGKIHENYDLFRRTAKIQAEGSVTPAPSAPFKVELEIKQCVNGVFVKIGDRFATGQAGTGKFTGIFSAGPIAPKSTQPGAIAYERVRARIGSASSEYDYFAVTN